MIDRLHAANVALCFHDWRELPVRAPVTADFVYVRRHGTSPTRYHGAYSDAMLLAKYRQNFHSTVNLVQILLLQPVMHWVVRTIVGQILYTKKGMKRFVFLTYTS